MTRPNRHHAPAGVLAACLLGAVLGAWACTLQLHIEVACGDGYADPEAGEECDPADLDSFADACKATLRPNGTPACDPVTCQLINDDRQCATCGDAIIDAGEECDGDSLANELCASGDTAVRCTPDCKFDYSQCDLCGDGNVDTPLEECDTAAIGDIATSLPCAMLPSPISKAYTYGEATRCIDCQLSRLDCSYCNDGVRDEPLPQDTLSEVTLTLREVCDGDQVDLQAMFEELPNSDCWEEAEVQPNVACGDNCLGFVPRTDQPPCCLQSGATCPVDAFSLRCCYEYAHPELGLADVCDDFVNLAGEFSSTCR